MNINIDGKLIGDGEPPYIVAEMSANHNGSLDRALKTIELAKSCGASAVKLQTYLAETMTIDSDATDFMIKGGLWDGFKLYDLYKWAETPYEWHSAIFNHAKKCDITIFSTPFDETAVDLLESLDAPAYKIASFELTDLPLIRYVASTNKPMIISTGMGSEIEIEEALTVARDAGCKDIILLHCISSYPAPIDQANLRQLNELSRRFNVVSGLSDHTMGSAASVAAVTIGASFIEKHFTLSRLDKGPDSDFSLEPSEFSQLCKDTYDAWAALGRIGYERQTSEEGNRMFRRSIYFVNDLPAGAVVKSTDIRRIRPGMGLPPKYFNDLIGRRLRFGVSRGTPASWSLFDE